MALFIVAAFVTILGVLLWRESRKQVKRDARIEADAARIDYPFSYRFGKRSITFVETGFSLSDRPGVVPFDSIFYIARVAIGEGHYKWRIRYDAESPEAVIELGEDSEELDVAVRVLALKTGVEIDAQTAPFG